MQVYAPPARGKPGVNDKTFALSVVVSLVLLISVCLPLAATLPERYIQKLPLNILVPLYLYPNPGSWEPLFEIIIKHASLNFIVIVNPGFGPDKSGPGTPPYPGALYIDVITRLNVLPNVQVVGYIDTKYMHRENVTVLSEIETYSGWSHKQGLDLRGIFFDHTPGSDSLQAMHYLRNVSAAVKATKGFSEPKLVIHNPGRIPQVNLTMTPVDLIVVFEDAYSEVPAHETAKVRLASLSRPREQMAYLIHSVPTDASKGELRKLVNNVRKDVEWVYVTDREEHIYEGVGETLSGFADLTW